jgi:hypothetical protein
LNGVKRRSRPLPADQDTATLSERVNALKQKFEAEDERERMLDLGADRGSADLHARAVLALRRQGLVDPSPDQYIQAVEHARRMDDSLEPARARLDYDELHAAATRLLKERGKDKPTYADYADALPEVAS